MKFNKVLFGIIIALTLWNCKAGIHCRNHQKNRKQKKLIEGSMDLNVDPCEDFYKYACGNWNRLHAEAGGKYFEPVTLLDYNVNGEMSRAFECINLRCQPKFIKEAYLYYSSCASITKYEAINYLGWLAANDNFKWPALWTQSKDDVQFDWVKMLAKMRTYGFNDVFVQQIVIANITDVEKFLIDLDKPVSDGGFKPMTKKYLSILMDALGAEIPNKNVDKLWSEIEEFEEKLQELDTIEDDEVNSEQDYENLRLFYVKDLPFEWLKDYLRIILNKRQLNEEMQLYIQNIPYMKAFDELTKQYSQRFLCKYLTIRFLWFLHTNGPVNFIKTDCLASIRSLMPTAMHWLYEQQHPGLSQEYQEIYDIFNNVRKHFNNTVIKNKYGFNDTIIDYLQNKINHMKLRLNNIPRINNTIDTLEKFYQPLNLDNENFYENHLKLLRFNFMARRNLLSRKKPFLDYTYLESTETGSSSSPYFVQNANTIFVPLTLLQPPIYSPGLYNIYKYSSLGFLIAHEMFHGFDDTGLLTDANGNIAVIQFEENLLFNGSLNCLLEINPQVISEKIADISGLRYAYQTFFDTHSHASTQSIYLNGHRMSFRKLFFLNFAQFFCGDSSIEIVSMSEHGSDRDRLMDALSHFPEFSKEFECNRNHRMYPSESCYLWR